MKRDLWAQATRSNVFRNAAIAAGTTLIKPQLAELPLKSVGGLSLSAGLDPGCSSWDVHYSTGLQSHWDSSLSLLISLPWSWLGHEAPAWFWCQPKEGMSGDTGGRFSPALPAPGVGPTSQSWFRNEKPSEPQRGPGSAHTGLDWGGVFSHKRLTSKRCQWLQG